MISVLQYGLFQVETHSGEKKAVGLRELFANAHRLADLCGRTPTGRLALLRLCISFLEDIYRPQSVKERKRIFESGSFDMDLIEGYFKDCESRYPCFLLDDESHPFMQMPFDPAMDSKAEKPVAALFADEPSGNNHVHWEHRPLDAISAGASEAFEGMLETYLFCTAGAQGYPSGINNTAPVYCVIRGRNLFETLALNMVSSRELGNIPFGEGMVPWRRNSSIVPKEMVASVSFLEAMTWQPRRITLVFDEDHQVRRIYLQQGRNFVGDGRWRDPWVPFRKKRNEEIYLSIKPVLGRQMWRDVGCLLFSQKGDSIAPVAIANVCSVWEDMPNEVLPVETVGMITNQAAYIGLTYELLRLPEVLLDDEIRADHFKRWIAITENVYGGMSKIIGGEYAQGIAQLVGERFLREIRDALFGPLVNLLIDPGTEEHEVDLVFGKALKDALWESLSEILENSGKTVKNLKKQNLAEAKAMGYCAKILKEEGIE